ncbi:MAG: translocation/assembly module TamB domain-containing protein [Caulobacterales bacterium]
MTAPAQAATPPAASKPLSRSRRWIVGGAVLATLLLLVAVARFGVLTPVGRGFIEAQANGRQIGRFGTLRIEGLQGDVWRDFSIRRLTISDAAGPWVDAAGLHVSWRPLQLLGQRLDIELAECARVSLLHRPQLSQRRAGRGVSLDYHLGTVRARVLLAPTFSVRQDVYDLSGTLDATRKGSTTGRFVALGRTHAGDRVDADFHLGQGDSVALKISAVEARGGGLGGALGLAADQPFLLSIIANGTTHKGNFQLTSRIGEVSPAEASGAWNPAGGSAHGRILLAASRLLAGYQKRLGPEAAFDIAGARQADGFYATTLSVLSQNVDLTAKGEADLGRLTAGPGGMAVTLAARDSNLILSWPKMGASNFSGTFTGDSDKWRLAGALAVDGAQAAGYRLVRAAGPTSLTRQGGEMALQTSLDGQGGQGSGLAAALLGARPHGDAQLTWLKDGRLLMRALAVKGAGITATGEGQSGLFGDLSFKGQATLANLAAARSGARGVIQAAWTASQTRDKPWNLSVDAGAQGFATGVDQVDHLLGATPKLKGDGTYDGKTLAIAHANLIGAAGDANAVGPVGPDGSLDLKLDWRAQGPFTLGPVDIGGAAKGSGALGGTVLNPRADLAADFAAIDLPGLPLTAAHVTLNFVKGPAETNGGFALAATSDYGPAKANANFRFLSDGLDFTGLAVSAGGANATGTASLRGGQPSSADLAITLGRGAFLTKGQAQGRLRIVDASGGPRAELTASARNATTAMGGVILTTANLSAAGPLTAMPYHLDGTGYTTHGSWKLNGTGVMGDTKGEYDVSFEGAGRLRTVDFKTLSPAQLRIGRHGLTAQLIANVGGGRAVVDSSETGGRMETRAELTGVSLNLLDQDFMGRFDADLHLTGAGEHLAGDMEAKLAGAGQRGAKGAPTVDGLVHVLLAGDAMTIDAHLGNAQGMKTDAHLVLPAEATAAPFRIALVRNRPMSGHFSAQGEVKPIWDLVMGGERSLSGQVNAAGTVAGTMADPLITGQATVQNGQFTDAPTGLTLQKVTLSARLADNAIDVSQFTASDDHAGTLSGVGRISLEREGVSSFKLDLKGFQLIDNEIGTATATGTATVSRTAAGLVELSGILNVDRADIAAKPPTPSGVASMDVVEINRPVGTGGHLQAVTSYAPPVAMDVRLKAARGVFLKGRGLNLEVSLDAHVQGTTDAPAIGGTARVVRGDYDLAGKRFIFDNRGVVSLGARPEDIRLDLTATREDPSLTAVIAIQGTAARPKIMLSSTPVLPGDEVLSQVLFGASAAQLSPLDAAQLASALSALAGGGGFDVIGNIRNFAHLDRLALGGGTAAAGVTVSGGKYVTDNVYLEVTGGVKGGSSAGVEWRVKRNLAIVSRVAATGGDSQLQITWHKDY